MSLNGRTYRIESILDQGPFQAKPRQRYSLIPFKNSNEYILVREQEQAEQPDQTMVMMSSQQRRVWFTSDVRAQSPRIMGGRNWDYRHEPGAPLYRNARILGVAEVCC